MELRSRAFRHVGLSTVSPTATEIDFSGLYVGAAVAEPEIYDLYNACEADAVATIQADAWLGSLVNVASVHQKLRMGSDPAGFYFPHELPAIGCLVRGGGEDEKVSISGFELSMTLVCDIWTYGGDLDAADTQAKRIMARLRRLLRIQTFAPAVLAASTQLNGFVTDGDIDNQAFDFDYFPDEGGWLVNGVTTAWVTRCVDEEE